MLTIDDMLSDKECIDRICKVVDGNPGAVTAMVPILKSVPNPEIVLEMFEALPYRGVELWDLFKNQCEQNYDKLALCIAEEYLALRTKAVLEP